MRTTPTILHKELPDDVVGHYDRDLNVIYIDPRTSCRTQRCTMVHEHIHWENEDGPAYDEILDARRENQVEKETARRLVTIEAIVDGLLWCLDSAELAEHWDVDADLVLVRLGSLTEHELDIVAFFVDPEAEFLTA